MTNYVEFGLSSATFNELQELDLEEYWLLFNNSEFFKSPEHFICFYLYFKCSKDINAIANIMKLPREVVRKYLVEVIREFLHS